MIQILYRLFKPMSRLNLVTRTWWVFLFNSFNANEFFSNLFNPNEFFFFFLIFITNSLTFWSFKRKMLYYEKNIFHYLFTIISTITFLDLYKVIMKKIIISKWFKLFSFNFFFQNFTLI